MAPMDRTELFGRLDERLDTEAYADVDASANGLQVGRSSGTVDHVAFAVDGVKATFETAGEAGADVLVVHHGISWGGFERVTGRRYHRVATLVETDIALYVSHLPLDGHPDIGNAALLAEHLDLGVSEPFGRMGSEHVGQRARASTPRTVDDLRDRLADLEHGEWDTYHADGNGGEAEGEVETGGGAEGDVETGHEAEGDVENGTDARVGVRVLPFGPDRIEDVGIVTGAGTDWIDEAREKDLDALVTGEGKQQAYHAAREAGLHVFLAGHYATETLGVRALRDVVDGWGVETSYHSHPTGI